MLKRLSFARAHDLCRLSAFADRHTSVCRRLLVERSFPSVLILCPTKNSKTAQTGGLLFLAGAERLFRSAPPSLSSLRDRRASASLSFGVERSSRVLILCPTQKHQNRPNGRFVVFGRGRTIRTLDTWFWRPMLYQLSYTPIISELLIKHFVL